MDWTPAEQWLHAHLAGRQRLRSLAVRWGAPTLDELEWAWANAPVDVSLDGLKRRLGRPVFQRLTEGEVLGLVRNVETAPGGMALAYRE